ncbi:MAG: GMC oxidoreductase [Candidatus Acidiferrales bacterium]
MSETVVVGAGPTAVHFALSLLRKGRAVTMLDVGYSGNPPLRPADSLQNLKENLDDPAEYFLGKNFEGVLLPDVEKEYYGIPPGKQYIFRNAGDFRFRSRGFEPLFSFAQGGMAQAWTAGCYPFNDAEFKDFPFGYAEIEPHYNEVARRIGITGEPDDLARFFPLHANLLAPIPFDRHSRLLMEEYARRKSALNGAGFYMGRTRVATLTRDMNGRKACQLLGRCLWGCPTLSLYTPSITLAECREFPQFKYGSGMRVTHFRYDAGHRVRAVVAEPVEGGAPQEFPAETLVLAAGALSSTYVYLNSIYRDSGEVVSLVGFMDNRQVLVPFVNLRLLGKPYDPDTYQYHLVGLGLEAEDPRFYVHGQVTTLKTGLLHPIMQDLPVDLRTASYIVRNAHCALGIVNVNFHDTRRETNTVSLETEGGAGSGSGGDRAARLAIYYQPAADEPRRRAEAVKRVGKGLWKLGCVVPPGMAHLRPMGASAHYAGTLPMLADGGPHTTTADGRSRLFENLYVIDGASYPFLPAKNITFTLMANAVRVAETAF